MRHLLFMSALGSFLSALLTPFALCAQLSWSGGLVLGTNLSSTRTELEGFSNKDKFGYVIGLRLGCHPGDRLLIQAEALLERKGSRMEVLLEGEGGVPSKALAKNHFDYLVFPLTVQWRFGHGNFRYGPYAGGFVAKLIRETDTLQQGRNFISSAENTTLFRQSDAGVIAGFGADWALGKTLAFTLEARYNLSLTSHLPEFSKIESNHQSLALMAGMRFILGQ